MMRHAVTSLVALASLVAAEVPQEHSHEQFLIAVDELLALNNPLGIQASVFGLLGNAAASEGAGDVTDFDCLHQITADQAFTNAKEAGDVDGMANALIFRAIERNTGSVGLRSVLCNQTAENPEIDALSQHQDPASEGAAAENKAITLALAQQLASVGADPQLALLSGTFAPGEIGDPTGAGNTCNELDDADGCIFTQGLLVEDATAEEIDAAVAEAAGGAADDVDDVVDEVDEADDVADEVDEIPDECIVADPADEVVDEVDEEEEVVEEHPVEEEEEVIEADPADEVAHPGEDVADEEDVEEVVDEEDVVENEHPVEEVVEEDDAEEAADEVAHPDEEVADEEDVEEVVDEVEHPEEVADEEEVVDEEEEEVVDEEDAADEVVEEDAGEVIDECIIPEDDAAADDGAAEDDAAADDGAAEEDAGDAVKEDDTAEPTPTAGNLQTFTGALGGAAPPVVSQAGDRPFVVNGAAFLDVATANVRSCDIQNNQCFNAINGGQLDAETSECQTQQAACIANARGGAARRVVRRRVSRRALRARQDTSLDLGSCVDPTIVFAAGLDGRQEESFAPANAAEFSQGSALNINIITSFICGRLSDSCDAPEETVQACQAAASAASAQEGQAAAAAFNSALGF